MSKLKQDLFLLCREYVTDKEVAIKKLISEAQEAANEETKSSAGDKFETGREVMQQEVELNLTRLNELNKIKQTLDMIAPDQSSTVVSPGAAVRTTQGNYYIAISAGKLSCDGQVYYAISIASPIGEKMKGMQAGDSFVLNGKTITIEKVS
jgi:transcription elongation GreA/GreB family factor